MTDQLHFEVFAFWRTSATYRVRVALNLKGLVADERIVNIDAGEQRGTEFLTINPLGGIPALVESGHPPMTQSLAILEYLDELQPMPPLLPTDLHGRARVRAIALMLAADTHPFVTPRVKKYLTSIGGFDDGAFKAWQLHRFTTGLQAVEQRLATEAATGTYCHGNSVTMADIVLCSIVVVVRAFKIVVADIPVIDAIVARCEALEAFAKAAPLAQAGAPQA